MSFMKGQSGNLGGRPKTWHTVRELARKYKAEVVSL